MIEREINRRRNMDSSIRFGYDTQKLESRCRDGLFGKLSPFQGFPK